MSRSRLIKFGHISLHGTTPPPSLPYQRQTAAATCPSVMELSCDNRLVLQCPKLPDRDHVVCYPFQQRFQQRMTVNVCSACENSDTSEKGTVLQYQSQAILGFADFLQITTCYTHTHTHTHTVAFACIISKYQSTRRFVQYLHRKLEITSTKTVTDSSQILDGWVIIIIGYLTRRQIIITVYKSR
jgi:hypothetical protein